jgi:hypothetical protein
MRTVIFIVSILLYTTPGFCQGAGAPMKPEELVQEWFTRLNALDDWFITMDGKEEPEAVVNRFVELYDPEALLFIGPNENQIGTATYYRHEGIRKWADDFARKFVQLAYRPEVQTAKEKTATLIHAIPMPWGGTAVSVEFVAFYGIRESRRRFVAPGAAFFQFSEAGKIQRLRLFVAKDELYEVVR